MILWISGLCAVSAACIPLRTHGWGELLLIASVPVTGLCAWFGIWRRTASAELSFDGDRWALSGPDGASGVHAHVRLDLQSLLLVGLVDRGAGPRWLWLDRQAMPERWGDLRRALYSRAPSSRSPNPEARAAAATDIHHRVS